MEWNYICEPLGTLSACRVIAQGNASWCTLGSRTSNLKEAYSALNKNGNLGNIFHPNLRSFK